MRLSLRLLHLATYSNIYYSRNLVTGSLFFVRSPAGLQIYLRLDGFAPAMKQRCACLPLFAILPWGLSWLGSFGGFGGERGRVARRASLLVPARLVEETYGQLAGAGCIPRPPPVRRDGRSSSQGFGIRLWDILNDCCHSTLSSSLACAFVVNDVCCHYLYLLQG